MPGENSQLGLSELQVRVPKTNHLDEEDRFRLGESVWICVSFVH